MQGAAVGSGRWRSTARIEYRAGTAAMSSRFGPDNARITYIGDANLLWRVRSES
jgi:hypothetical protein